MSPSLFFQSNNTDQWKYSWRVKINVSLWVYPTCWTIYLTWNICCIGLFGLPIESAYISLIITFILLSCTTANRSIICPVAQLEGWRRAEEMLTHSAQMANMKSCLLFFQSPNNFRFKTINSGKIIFTAGFSCFFLY